MSGASIDARDSESRSGYRPEIEGMRAVAVLAVIGFHAGLPFAGGGFVGVDVFYVISGFLITGLIVREFESSVRLDLASFYARRARRLLPAALVVIVVTVVASALLLPPLRLPDVAGDAAAAALYVGNIRFAAQATDYLRAEFDPSPLLHYWSLGVEEQFYLVWPLLLLVALRRRLPPARLAAVLTLLGIASFALGVVVTAVDEPLGFFLLPTRAWELALGGVIAIVAAHGRSGWSLSSRTATLLAVGGVALIATSTLIFGVDTPYPGVAAIVPAAGGALVLLGVSGPAAWPSRLLGAAPLAWIGRISYSAYLWHWPLLVIPAAARGEPLPLGVRFALAAAVMPIAAVSERWIERPFRRGHFARWQPRRALPVALAASVTVATITSAVGLAVGYGASTTASATLPTLVLPTPITGGDTSMAGASAGSPSLSRLPATPHQRVPADLVPPLATAREDISPIFREGCHLAARDTTSGECAYGSTESRTVAVLFGDSHAAQWFPALEQISLRRNWRLEVLTKAACPAAAVTVWSATLRRPYAECDEWRDGVMARIAQERPALVVVSSSRFIDLAVDGNAVPSQQRNDLWTTGLDTTLRRLRPLAGTVVVIGDTPNPFGDPPACLSAHADDAFDCATPIEKAVSVVRLAAERDAAASEGAIFIDPTAWVCPSVPCPAVVGRFLVYRDGGHIARAFGEALAPYLDAALPPSS